MKAPSPKNTERDRDRETEREGGGKREIPSHINTFAQQQHIKRKKETNQYEREFLPVQIKFWRTLRF